MNAVRIPFLLDILSHLELGMSDKRLGGEKSVEVAFKYAVFLGGLHKSMIFLEEEAWIMADDLCWEFSFINLCNEFGIEPESLRQAFVKWKEAQSL